MWTCPAAASGLRQRWIRWWYRPKGRTRGWKRPVDGFVVRISEEIPAARREEFGIGRYRASGPCQRLAPIHPGVGIRPWLWLRPRHGQAALPMFFICDVFYIQTSVQVFARRDIGLARMRSFLDGLCLHQLHRRRRSTFGGVKRGPVSAGHGRGGVICRQVIVAAGAKQPARCPSSAGSA